ncbi:MAG TPA: 50S ribosomal protein L2 [Candidatus Paceibacterota bacterium]|nr:50S ribosomal protein L2 [Candidatus Paceibacterota bacterium]
MSNSQKQFKKGKKSTGARNSQGRMTVRWRGGGHKRKYRQVDFVQDKHDIPAKVESIDYDPNRTADIALLSYEDGEKRYILAPDGLEVGDKVVTSDEAPIEKGNRTLLKRIPIGTLVHNVEMKPGRGGQIGRSAGTGLQVLGNEEGYTHLKMPSTEIRKIRWDCYASIGQVSNPEHGSKKLRKAGQSRWRGRRPKVRAYAMGAHDHKYGGGEGRQPRGTKYPKDKWGNITGGRKTRKKNKKSDKYIIQRRKKKKKKKK